MKYTAPRGTRDILCAEMALWNKVREAAVKILYRYQYQEISTPVFEQTELFARGIGKLTDIVEKEMYTFQDKKGRSLTLRPEGTASIVRAYLENNLAQNGLQKLFYQGPMFRYERPQAGRYRQFEQIGVEIIGTQAPIVDAEAIAVGIKICQELKLENLSVAINSVGCPLCRPVIREQLKSFINSSLNKLCEDCNRRYEKNPLRILDCKNPTCQQYFAGLPQSLDVLCQECADHFNSVVAYLDVAGVPYKIDANLVRGLDYYTKTAFEIRSEHLGAQNSICGGGRYDELVRELGGPKTPAFGFAFGLERVVMLLAQKVESSSETQAPQIYFVTMGEIARRKAFASRLKLGELGVRAELDLGDKSFKAQFKAANDSRAQYVCILGEDELEKGTCQLKDMTCGIQEEIPFDKLEERLLPSISKL